MWVMWRGGGGGGDCCRWNCGREDADRAISGMGRGGHDVVGRTGTVWFIPVVRRERTSWSSVRVVGSEVGVCLLESDT